MNNERTIVHLRDVNFAWKRRQSPLLSIRDFKIRQGEKLFIKGQSGSGKTTLLGVIGGVLLPQQGEVMILGKNVNRLRASKRDHFRSEHIGFIFQLFNLIPYLSVLENVLLPCQFSPRRKKKALERSESLEKEAIRLLSELGMDDPSLTYRQVTELSVGQQQRVAAARALLGSPELLIADEPTSSLDHEIRESFIQLLFQEASKVGTTIVFVSHDPSLARLFNRSISIMDFSHSTE